MSNWNQFNKRITINASAEKIYEALATQSGIERWFLRLAEFTKDDGEVRGATESVKIGDKYLWKWFGWGEEANQSGKILAANGKDFIQFTFHDPMVVSINILNENNVNIVELQQEHIPTDEDSRSNYFVGCGEGWTFYLTNLKSILEGGLDLRNRNENIKQVINS